MYINAATECDLSHRAKLILYADDFVLVKPINSDEAETELQSDVESIYNFFSSINLSLNKSKSKYMLFSIAPRPVSLSLPVLGNDELEVMDWNMCMSLDIWVCGSIQS